MLVNFKISFLLFRTWTDPAPLSLVDSVHCGGHYASVPYEILHRGDEDPLETKVCTFSTLTLNDFPRIKKIPNTLENEMHMTLHVPRHDNDSTCKHDVQILVYSFVLVPCEVYKINNC